MNLFLGIGGRKPIACGTCGTEIAGGESHLHLDHAIWHLVYVVLTATSTQPQNSGEGKKAVYGDILLHTALDVYDRMLY